MIWNPWTIEDGTLQLQEWPDHPPGNVLVEVDVFEPYSGRICDHRGCFMSHLEGACEILTLMQDVLRDLFRHIDAHPQTTYTLRTLHPERVRECWPAVSEVNDYDWCDGSGMKPCGNPDCGFIAAMGTLLGHANGCPECGHAGESPCDGCGNCVRHRPNITISLGPLATQADADRLVSEVLECGGLVNGDLEAYCQPTERIDFTEIARDDGWMIDSLQGVYTREYPPGIDHPGGIEGHGGGPRFTRIRVAGGEQPLHPDWVRCVRGQCEAAGVEFVFDGWGDFRPWIDSDAYQPGGMWLSDDGKGFAKTDSCTQPGYVLLRHVGREHSGRTLDGREWPGREG